MQGPQDLKRLESLLEQFKSQGKDTKGLMIQLLVQYAKNGEVEKASNIMKVRLNCHRIVFNSGSLD